MPELVQAAGHQDIELAPFPHQLETPLETPMTEVSEQDATPSTSRRHLMRSGDADSELNAVGLPPVDKGRRAWTFVLNAFFLETFVWGWGYSYGSLNLYLSTHAPFNESSLAAISSIGTVALALQFMLPFGLMLIFKRYSDRVKTILWAALAVNCGAMLISSFASHVWQLILLQGVLGGISGAVLYTPVLMWLQEWFSERRGLASGIIFAGTGCGGFCFPFFIESVLDKHGFAWTCRIWSFVTLAVFGFSVATIQPRLPPTKFRGGRFLPLDMSFVYHPVVIAMFFTTLLASLSYFPVSLFLPIYVSSLSSSSFTATTVLAIYNAVAVFGQIGAGFLSDRFEVAHIIAGLGIGSGITALVAWGFANTLAKTFAFAILYGAFSGIASTWTTVARDVAGYNPLSASMIFSIFSIARGTAAIVGPLIASALYDRAASSNSEPKWGAYGFSELVTFVGALAFASALGGYGVLGVKRIKSA